MHHFDGNPPYPHLQEGMTPTLPLSALRVSVNPSASDPGALANFNHAPEENRLDTPEQVGPYIKGGKDVIHSFWHLGKGVG